MTAQKVAQWISEVRHGSHDVKPVEVTIDGQTWQGAYYRTTDHYQAGMMAVTHGDKTVNDTYTQEMIYLVGKLPKAYKTGNRTKICFPWGGQDWYIAGYATEQHITPEVASYHPFGAHFMIAPWNIPGEAIDKYERKPYTRIAIIIKPLS